MTIMHLARFLESITESVSLITHKAVTAWMDWLAIGMNYLA
ncbi:hypothetical protein [Plantactinospora soyae]|uniref:Uncharacterized protein n=1 Tax=Plantactinospora soyae TaxID=1544732 RepID=A0A927M3X5_9ACTN|nr:hypothetical protein [Plantactinospora soyae]MBE1487234.1 hypothetical protein [Plantactinospora soyae]